MSSTAVVREADKLRFVIFLRRWRGQSQSVVACAANRSNLGVGSVPLLADQCVAAFRWDTLEALSAITSGREIVNPAYRFENDLRGREQFGIFGLIGVGKSWVARDIDAVEVWFRR